MFSVVDSSLRLASKAADDKDLRPAFAMDKESPVFRRPITVSHQSVLEFSQLPSLQYADCEQIGTATSKEWPISGPVKPACVTPTIGTGCRPMVSVRPIA